MDATPLLPSHEAAGAQLTRHGGFLVPDRFGDAAEEYAASARGAALHDRSYRGLIEITGRDRATWLHNFVTNAVTTLRPGDGVYAFALNAKGRIVFDCNILAGPETIQLDVERSHVATAMTHLNRHIITEDVALTDLSNAFARVALLGPGGAEILAKLGTADAPAMTQLQHATMPLAGRTRAFVRHDFAGVFGAELWIETRDAQACWRELLRVGKAAGIRPVGLAAVQTLRIEAGIPWLGQDIDEDVLPAETLQTERGISYVKGCYLGQEIVERMRSRGALARQLTGVRIDGNTLPDVPARIQVDGTDAGRLTSACHSPHVGGIIGLGYVKTSLNGPGKPVTVVATNGTFLGALSTPPFRR